MRISAQREGFFDVRILPYMMRLGERARYLSASTPWSWRNCCGVMEYRRWNEVQKCDGES